MTPDMFGPYQLRGLIGRGGMGEVHRAYDTRRQRTVALKQLRVEFIADDRFRERFLKECRRAARLTQAHVIPIHDFGEIDGRLYLDMRLIEGHNLAEAVAAAGPFPPERAVEIVGQIAGALDAAHAAGIVHRDVKPANVLVETHGPSMHCYLTDFGVAGAIGDTGGVSGTATGGVLGTYDYIAPERLLGRPSDRRVDVYALACLLYEVVTGTPPFRRDEIPAMIHAHLNVEPPRASQVVAGVPPMLDAVIARGMAKNPQARYPTAGELAEAARSAVLGDRAASPAAARPVAHPSTSSARTDGLDLNTVPLRARRRPLRRTAGLLVAAVLALAIAGTSTAVTWYFLRPVVHLEAAASVGAEPPFIPEELNPPAAPPSTQEVVPAAVSVVAGDTPGLYGGTRANECNVAGTERYLDANPDRGQAWARAEGVGPGEIHRVLTSLTPVTLRTDTAVTNHGYANGSPTQFQSVLQAGTAVLIDALGVPRVRCYCGNPLLRPEQPTSVRYEGPTWTTFSTESVTVVNKAAAPVAEFVVVERDTKKVVSRPRATSGEKDHDADPAITKKVKDKPIGEGTTSSRSDASTDGSQSGKNPGGDVPADQRVNRNRPPDNPPGSPGEPPTNPDEPPTHPDGPPANAGLPGEPADEQGPPVAPATPPAPPVDPGPPLDQAGPADDPAPSAEPAPVEKRLPAKTKAPVKKEPPVTPPAKPPPAKPPAAKAPPAKKPATDNAPEDQPAPHRGSAGNGNGSGSTGGSGSGETNSGSSGSVGDNGDSDSGDSGGGGGNGGESGDSGGESGDSGGGDNGGGDNGDG
jgi:Protein kinase domain